jgi:hypothetical protein
VVNPEAVAAIGTDALDALNQTALPPTPSTTGQEIDPFTAAFRAARRLTEVPDELLQRPQDIETQTLPLPPALQLGPTRVQPQTPIGRPTISRTGEFGTEAVGENPSLRALAYGPQSEGATAADMRQVRGSFVSQLQRGDIAVSPNLLGRYPPLSKVNVVDSEGNVVMRDARVADTSWYSEGNPTHNTFEIYNGPSLGSGYHLVPVSATE